MVIDTQPTKEFLHMKQLLVCLIICWFEWIIQKDYSDTEMENGTTIQLSPRCESGKDVFLPERYVRLCMKLIMDVLINEVRGRNSCALS